MILIGVAGLGGVGLTELPVFGGGVREDPAEGDHMLMHESKEFGIHILIMEYQ